MSFKDILVVCSLSVALMCPFSFAMNESIHLEDNSKNKKSLRKEMKKKNSRDSRKSSHHQRFSKKPNRVQINSTSTHPESMKRKHDPETQPKKTGHMDEIIASGEECETCKMGNQNTSIKPGDGEIGKSLEEKKKEEQNARKAK